MKTKNNHSSGKLGNVVYYVQNGQQIAREYVSGNVKKNPKTEAQMNQRTKWANIANVYRSFGRSLRGGFEKKPAGWNDFNSFVSINLLQPGVYLTKQQARQQAAVAAPYIITQGSLDSITVTDGVTDISLGDFSAESTATVAEFAEAVVENNAGSFRYYDQLTCFVVEQKRDETTEVPYVRTSYLKVVLDPTDKTALQSVVGNSLGFSISGGKLALGGTVDGAYAWVHSRKGSEGLYVSTQKLVCTNPVYQDFTLAETRTLAGSSYGMKEGVVLNPGTTVAAGTGGTGGTGSTGGTSGGSGNTGGGGSTGGNGEDGDNPIG